jgi:release factor glutamine methyltransferase
MYDDFRETFRVFQECGAEDPLYETLHLIDTVSGGVLGRMDSSAVRSYLDRQNLSLSQVVLERRKGIPLEYVVQRAAFAGLSLHCSKGALIPVQWTELLVEVTLGVLMQRREKVRSQTILEVGTGCGNVAVSLAVRTDDIVILASDISPEAVEIARINVNEYHLSDRITVRCGDLFSPFPGVEGAVDVVVCNPPYIPTASLSRLPTEITDHEPSVALDGGPYGIDFCRRLILESVSILMPGGRLIFEVGVGLEGLASRILKRNGHYTDVKCIGGAEDPIRVMSAAKIQ